MSKESFYCQECGYETYKWMGRCPGCGNWGTFSEKKASHRGAGRKGQELSANNLAALKVTEGERVSTGIREFDRVLGGGAVKGSVLLIGGDPGIGKSTLILQASSHMNARGRVLYVSGEESLEQIKMRAGRLNIDQDFLAVSAAELGPVMGLVDKAAPDILIVDSIQAMYDEELDGIPGSINQVREVTAVLTRWAKREEKIVFIIGHVTKGGALAGPKTLEHMVDGVFYLEGDRYHGFRILRGIKNRFGSTNEIGVFLMDERGMKEVEDPSSLFISSRKGSAYGAAITAALSGSRPLLAEIQSLVTTSSYAAPRRTTMGVDHHRVALIMAVMEKNLGCNFQGLDTFVNVVGGVQLIEPSSDLAVAVSLLSSLKEKAVDHGDAFIGELGLTGEIRPVVRILPRVMEAERLGFKRCFIPVQNLDELRKERKISIEMVSTGSVSEAMKIIF
ncbi:MAG: DNA repair protein RadA [Firmicutes bacterium]|nr:DNA repair protein RadA [Bacillota bacterium]